MQNLKFKEYQLKTFTYFKRELFLKNIKKAILESISDVCGDTKRKLVREMGLKKMHMVIDPKFLPFITYSLNIKIKELVLKQVALVGKKNIKIENDFFVDDNVVYRIHYPYFKAKKSILKRKLYLAVNLQNYKDAEKEINRAKSNNTVKLGKSDIAKIKYHRGLPDAAYAHGPHRDTWFGHTFGALNLWWSICGVNKNAGLVIFPKDNGFRLNHLSMPAYLSPGQPISKPEIISLEDGKLYIFDPEILHATKLNTSEETRIVITGRINKNQPKFYADTNEAEYLHWHKSSNLLKNKFGEIYKFPRKNNSIKKPLLKRKSIRKRKEINLNIRFKRGENLYKLLKNYDFFTPTLLKFKNIELIIIKRKKDIYCFASACPHLGINLIDGFFEKKKVTCPGHGITFNLDNGLSLCKKLKTASFKVTIGKEIFLIS